MKNLMTIFSFLFISSTTFAVCPNVESLNQQKMKNQSESNKLTVVADYLMSRVNERGGEFENDGHIVSLALETRTKAVRMATAALQIQLQISKEILACDNLK